MTDSACRDVGESKISLLVMRYSRTFLHFLGEFVSLLVSNVVFPAKLTVLTSDFLFLSRCSASEWIDEQ